MRTVDFDSYHLHCKSIWKRYSSGLIIGNTIFIIVLWISVKGNILIIQKNLHYTPQALWITTEMYVAIQLNLMWQARSITLLEKYLSLNIPSPNMMEANPTNIKNYSHTPCGHVWVYLPNVSHPEAATRRGVTGNRYTLPLLPIRDLYVWAGAWAMYHLPWGLLTRTLFHDLERRRDERVYNWTSFICLISLHRVTIKADLPAPCYHIKYRLKQQGVLHQSTDTHVSADLKCERFVQVCCF